MRIYILRHATAELRAPGLPDSQRELTAEGKKELRAVLGQAHAAGVSPETILTSPWSRALETARMAGKTLHCEQVVETRSLLPDVAPAQVLREIRSLAKAKQVLLAGHQPQLSRLAAFLLEAPVAVDLKKGAMLRIDIEEKDGPPRGVLKWMLTPRLAGGK